MTDAEYKIYLPQVSTGVEQVPPPEVKYLRGVDVSYYQDALPWVNLVEHGLDFAVIKGNQGIYTINHVKGARDAGVKKVGLYFWHDPIMKPGTQLSYFSNSTGIHKPDFIALDLEQYWRNWNQYFGWLKDHNIRVDTFTSQQISDNAQAVAEGLAALGLPFLVYTAQWFCDEWSPDIYQWLPEYKLWWANYVDWGQAKYKISWQDFETFPAISVQKEPKMPNDLRWTAWQFTSRWIYPGQRYPWDTNLLREGFI